MKREILCLDCHSKRVASAGVPINQSYDDLLRHVVNPPEKRKTVYGKATIHFLCDSCSKHMTPGDECVALSAWFESRGIHYYPWESEYLEVTS